MKFIFSFSSYPRFVLYWSERKNQFSVERARLELISIILSYLMPLHSDSNVQIRKIRFTTNNTGIKWQPALKASPLEKREERKHVQALSH